MFNYKITSRLQETLRITEPGIVPSHFEGVQLSQGEQLHVIIDPIKLSLIGPLKIITGYSNLERVSAKMVKMVLPGIRTCPLTFAATPFVQNNQNFTLTPNF